MVSIETTPSGAHLSIVAGKIQINTATTPLFKFQLQPGAYNLLLKADGYKDIFDSLVIMKDSLVNRSYSLSHSKIFIDSVAFAKKQVTRKKRNIRRIIFSSLTFVGAGAGGYFEMETHKSLSYYKGLNGSTSSSEFDNAWNRFEDNSTKRNICYVLSGISCGLFLISIPF
jgi:hypothetical protein